MTVPPPARIGQLDFLRGLAVMGILLANLPAFGLPEAAYFCPLAWGGSTGADRVAWFATFVLVEGKLRGLFSLLFGASMLLVIDRASAAGESPARVHLARMAALFAIGCVHLYLVWWGDILTHYALVGAAAYLFVALPPRAMLLLSLVFIVIDVVYGAAGGALLLDSATRDTPDRIAIWQSFATAFGVPPRADLLAEVAANRTSFATATAWRWHHAMSPFAFVWLLGAQTLGAMLLGMAAYRSGFLAGTWTRAAYRRSAVVALGIALPLYALLAEATLAHGFDERWVYLASAVASPPLRLLATLGYAALFMLAYRAGGAWSARIAAVGRAAFTNYLGTSVLMLLLFTGLHRFGTLSRAELYLAAPIVWAIMLAWSQPWLARLRFGPLEWLWRSIARWEVQRMRRAERS